MSYNPNSKGNILHLCEFLGSMLLVIASISPVILFYQILKTDIALTVLADAIAVGFILFASIEVFSPVCTGFFNPAVTIALAIDGKLTWKQAGIYSVNQVLGGLTGLLISQLMFFDKIPKLFAISNVARSGEILLLKFSVPLFLCLPFFPWWNKSQTRRRLLLVFLLEV